MRAILLLLTLGFFAGCQRQIREVSTPEIAGKAHNIILLIGDGMGLTQLSTAYYYGQATPHFSRFRQIGFHQNAPTGAKITDSAAGATAFSTGFKSYNAAIGVDEDTIARETILEWAASQGKSTGVIATSSITHATPASFYAHVASRHQHEDIALDFLSAPVDYAAGGGYQYFNQRTSDERNLLAELRAKGTVVDTSALGQDLRFGQPYAFLLGPDSLHSIRGGRGDFLPEATRSALQYLSQDEDGFFLMVEGSQIDWGGHNNDADYVITEVLDFDQAVGAALDFAKRDGNTLVVVTADHETGGLSLSAVEVFGQRNYEHIVPTFSTGGHSAALIPVLAYGPGAEAFIGFYPNNEIFGKMKKAFKNEPEN